MKSLTELWSRIASELAVQCDIDAARDIETVTRRVKHEGESFLTISLPSFASDFERSLDAKKVDPGLFLSFKKRRGGLPAFLSGFLGLVFDDGTAVLRHDVDPLAVFAIRQLTHLFKKLEGECSEARVEAAYEAYIECELELKERDRNGGYDADTLRIILHKVFGEELNRMNNLVSTFNLDPAHGPGATADKKVANAKYIQESWPLRLDSHFPYLEYVLPNMSWYGKLDSVEFIEPRNELPVKVITVPKTRKTPRIIAVEPSAMQYAQQGLMRALVPLLESNQFGFVGFTDQMVNRNLAKQGSYDGSLATLDLKEASDRVPNSLVYELFSSWPELRDALQASRSRSAELPGQSEKIRLSKFASMGSAVCFPVEALVFTTIVLAGIQLALGRPLKRRDLHDLKGSLRVYGDDIVVPVDYVEHVVSSLQSYGMKVNTAKSFWNGKFRESCGGDYYDGSDVTPIRLSRRFATCRTDVDEFQSQVEFSNALHKAGLWHSARWVSELASGIAPLPCVADTSPGVGLFSFSGYQSERDCDKLHKPLVKAAVISHRYADSHLAEHWALRKTLAGSFSDPMHSEHLVRGGRPVSSRMKIRWVPAA